MANLFSLRHINRMEEISPRITIHMNDMYDPRRTVDRTGENIPIFMMEVINISKPHDTVTFSMINRTDGKVIWLKYFHVFEGEGYMKTVNAVKRIVEPIFMSGTQSVTVHDIRDRMGEQLACRMY